MEEDEGYTTEVPNLFRLARYPIWESCNTQAVRFLTLF